MLLLGVFTIAQLIIQWMNAINTQSFSHSLSLSRSLLHLALLYDICGVDVRSTNTHLTTNTANVNYIEPIRIYILQVERKIKQKTVLFLCVFFFFSSSLALCEHVIFARFFSPFLSFLLSQFMLFDFYCDEMQISIGRIDRYYSQLEMKLRH